MSVTAVPLRPVGKGGIALLWFGVILAVIAALALAWFGTHKGPVAKSPEAFMARNAHTPGVVTTASGLQYQILKAGEGPNPGSTDIALIGYRGSLVDDTVFDEAPQTQINLAQTVPGFAEGIQKMNRGARYRFWIPPALGYGTKAQTDQNGREVIPANALLVFDVTLLDFKSQAELMQQRMEQMRQQGNRGGGAQMPVPVQP